VCESEAHLEQNLWRGIEHNFMPRNLLQQTILKMIKSVEWYGILVMLFAIPYSGVLYLNVGSLPVHFS
jgi:hypothetical protein